MRWTRSSDRKLMTEHEFAASSAPIGTFYVAEKFQDGVTMTMPQNSITYLSATSARNSKFALARRTRLISRQNMACATLRRVCLLSRLRFVNKFPVLWRSTGWPRSAS